MASARFMPCHYTASPHTYCELARLSTLTGFPCTTLWTLRCPAWDGLGLRRVEPIAPRFRSQPAKWRALYTTVQSKRACFLSKQTPSGTVLTSHDLKTVFDRVQEDIPERHRQTVRAFIDAPGGWTSCSLLRNVTGKTSTLFDGFHREAVQPRRRDAPFYEENDPDLLPDADRASLSV